MRSLNRIVVVTMGVFLLVGYGASAARAGGPDNGFLIGDLNCDGEVSFGDINAFVLALTDPSGYQQQYPDCDLDLADMNRDGQVDFADINPFVMLLTSSEPFVAGYWDSGCLEGTEGPWCDPDEFELIVEGNSLHVIHRNATYNCCPDAITVTLVVQGDVLTFTEEEILTNPCYCICCYDVEVTVLGLSPGTYTVVYYWFDYDTGQIECYEDEIQIP